MVNEKSRRYMIDTLNEGADKYQDVASYRKVSAALCLMVGAIATAAGSLSTTCDYLNTGDKAIMWIAAVAALGKGGADVVRAVKAQKQANLLRNEALLVQNQKQK
jgi:hypothetical protein